MQPVPWVLRVSMRGAAKRLQCPAVDQEIDALGPAAVAAFDQHRFGAEREQPLCLRLHFGFVAGRGTSSNAAASGRLGVKTPRVRDELAQGPDRVGTQQMLRRNSRP